MELSGKQKTDLMVRPPGIEPGIAGLEGLHHVDCVLTGLDRGRESNSNQHRPLVANIYYETSVF